MSEEPTDEGKRHDSVVTEELLRSQQALQKRGECQGVWDDHKGIVTITNRSGKALQTIAGDKNELNIEEALYLVERGSLVVDGVDVKELWRHLVESGQEAVDAYIVYANLKRAGYDVRRGEGLEER